MKPLKIIREFDEFLFSHGASFTAVIIGGAALVLSGTTSRETRDIDILSPQIPRRIKELANEFRGAFPDKNDSMLGDWFNNGPDSLLNALPSDWHTRTKVIFQGVALQLSTLGRSDLLKSKLWAFCDRVAQDQEDLVALNPNRQELLDALPWLENQDGNPDWPDHVRNRLGDLAKALGYEL